MTDFYSVLQRAISSLPDGSGPQRRAVYDKARKALLKQLQSFDPPLPSSDVTAQRLALEDAIRKIENEIARQIRTRRAVQGAAGGQPAPKALAKPDAGRPVAGEEVAAQSPARAPAPPPEPPAPLADDPLAGDATREARAEAITNALSEATIAAPADPDEADLVDEPGPGADRRDQLPVPVARRRASPPADAPAQGADGLSFDDDGDAFEVGERSRRPAADDEAIEDLSVEDEADPAPFNDAADEAEATRPTKAERAAARKAAAEAKKAEKARKVAEAKRQSAARRVTKAEKKVRKRAAPVPVDEAGEGELERAPGRRGGVAKLALPVAVVVLGVGAAYATYTHRDTWMTALQNFGNEPNGGNRAPVAASGSGVAVEKNTDRLPSIVDGEETRTVTTTTVRGGQTGAANAAPGAAPRVVDPGADANQFAAVPSESAAETATQSVEGTADGEAQQAQEGPTGDAVAEFSSEGSQRAVLYEEALEAGQQGGAVAGAVEWAMFRRDVSGDGPEPVVVATTTIPERNLSATITMRENQDEALPASHLIEIQFDVPDDFQGGGVEEVPGIIMKPSEQARGDALRGAAAKVSSGLFWIALSRNEEDREANLRLLRERDWMDIPIKFESGRRAILTLRKGSDGFQSVNAAIQAWNRG